MYRPASSKIKSVCYLLSMGALCYFSTAYALDFECADDVPAPEYIEDIRTAEDTLYAETIEYLRGFISILTEKAEACDWGAEVITQSHPASVKTCLNQQEDVVTLIQQSQVILDHPEAFRTCFDTQKNYTKQELFTPSQQMQQESFVAEAVNRPLLADYYAAPAGDTVLTASGRELSENFIQIISNITDNPTLRDMSYLKFRHLWSAVGWIPMYSKRPDATNERFRGGYVYAEAIGPWGLLRIKSVNGKPYGLELGMTVQLADSFYPYHFHQPQEIYIAISNNACLDRTLYTLSDWDSDTFTRQDLAKGSDVTVAAADDWQQRFSYPDPGDILYIDRNNIHGFLLKKTCHQHTPQGLVTIWARTTAHEFEQNTGVCSVTDRRYQWGSPATPEYSYLCDLHRVPRN